MTSCAKATARPRTGQTPDQPSRKRDRRKPTSLIISLAIGFSLSAALVAGAVQHMSQVAARGAAERMAAATPSPEFATLTPPAHRAGQKVSRVLSPAQAVGRPSPAPRSLPPKKLAIDTTRPAVAGLSPRLFAAATIEPTSFMPSAAYRVALTESRRIALATPTPIVQVASLAAPVEVSVSKASAAPIPAPAPAAPVEAAAPPQPVEMAMLEQPAVADRFAAVLTPEVDATVIPTPRARPRHRMKEVIEPAIAAAPARRAPSVPVLAYARPDAGEEETAPVSRGPSFATPGRGVAVYDISAGMVYLPNGEKLEAHSGLGMMRDDPSYAHKKNRGPTPPHTYTLSMRESLFHGVRAIRLNPVGGARAIHNRDGLLAHTYMLGKRGDSNGCVSFKDYKRFLAAFQRGDVKQLVVVPRMETSALSRLASIFR